MNNLYRIRDWNSHYEHGDFKKCRHARWYPKSTKHDGKTFKRLMRLPRGYEHYLAFTLLEQVAAKSPRRGYICDAQGPLSADDLSLITEAPATIFKNAFVPLCAVGWLEHVVVDEQPETSESLGNPPMSSESVGNTPATEQDSTEQDSTEQDSTEHSVASATECVDLQELVDAWNKLGAPFSQVRDLTPKRRTTLRARLKSSFFKKNWRVALERLRISCFCRGETPSGSWIAGFDWFLKSDSVLLLVEGKYSGKEVRPAPVGLTEEQAEQLRQNYLARGREVAIDA